MGRYTLEDSVLTIQEGAKMLQAGTFHWNSEIREVVAPSTLKTIAGDSYYGAFSDCVRLEKVTLQRGLQKIGMHAFSGCKSLKEIYIPDTVKEIGHDAFRRCDSLAYIAVPGIPLSKLESKTMAALGYCAESERFTDQAIRAEYGKYIRSHLKTILNRAKQFGCDQAIAFLKEQGWYSELERAPDPKEIVLEIERAVLAQDAVRLKNLTEKYPSPELTARALGFACRTGGPQIVQLLLDCGYTFEYDAENEKLVSSYGLKYKASADGPYCRADFAMLPFYENVWDKRVFGKLENHYVRGTRIGYDGMMETYEIPPEFAMAEEHIRAENIDLVCRSGAMTQQNLNLALYYAVLRRESEINQLLQGYGAVLDAPWLYRGSEPSDRARASRLFSALSNEQPDVQYEIISRLMELSVKPLMITDTIVNHPGFTDETLGLMLSQGDTASVNATALLREAAAHNRIERAAVILKNTGIGRQQLLQLIDSAATQNQPEMTALLLDYSNQPVNTDQL